MRADRMTRVNELIRQEIAESLYRVMSNIDIDLSAITITRVITNPDLRTARVLVSVNKSHPERTRLFAVIKKHRSAIQQEIKKRVVLKYIPRLTFELDFSLEKGDRVLELLSCLTTTENNDPDYTTS